MLIRLVTVIMSLLVSLLVVGVPLRAEEPVLELLMPRESVLEENEGSSGSLQDKLGFLASHHFVDGKRPGLVLVRIKPTTGEYRIAYVLLCINSASKEAAHPKIALRYTNDGKEVIAQHRIGGGKMHVLVDYTYSEETAGVAESISLGDAKQGRLFVIDMAKSPPSVAQTACDWSKTPHMPAAKFGHPDGLQKLGASLLSKYGMPKQSP